MLLDQNQIASMHVIMCTMYVCNWAPRLALRGPSGSLQRAFVATKSEKVQINVIFTIGVISFAAQTIFAVWVIDDSPKPTPHALYASAMGVLVLIADVIYHKRIHYRFFGNEEIHAGGERSGNPSSGPLTSVAPLPPAPRDGAINGTGRDWGVSNDKK